MYHHQSSPSTSDFSENESYDNVKNGRPKFRPNHFSTYSSTRTSSTFSDSSSYSENDDSQKERGLNRTEMKRCIRGERKGPEYDQEDKLEGTDLYGRSEGKRFRKRSYDSRSRSISPKQPALKRSRSRLVSYDKTMSSDGLTAIKNPPIETPPLQKDEKHSTKAAVNHIVLPSYYNRKAINPKKYAERMRKRNMLWKKEVIVNDNRTDEKNIPGHFWQKTTLGHDRDGKITAKFMRLMGIKSVNQGDQISKKNENEIIRKREEMFYSMESQYEAARLATHARRGAGLGFGTFQS